MTDINEAGNRAQPFFGTLPSFDDFMAVFDGAHYTPIPDGWAVVITDIKGSTKAITEGRYKDVNMVGAASISAVLNVTRTNEVPFSFGGDGATFVVPQETLPRVRDALLKTRNLAAGGFGMELRVGAVPIAVIRALGADVRVAKYRLSEGNYLAMFDGGGLALADKMIKDDDGSKGYRIDDDIPDEAPDLEGLSCRWEPLSTQRGRMLTILVQSLNAGREDQSRAYQTVLAELVQILGPNFHNSRPVTEKNMRFRWPPRGLRAEAITSRGDRPYFRRLMFLYWQSFLQFLLETFDLSGGGYDAPEYRKELRANSDYRRFDDTLRMVLDCTVEEVRQVEACLERLHQDGLIAYGTHQADNALMTCLLFSLADSKHVHFIDGGNGGYAMAAANLKRQLAAHSLRAGPT
jgi:hypothetical protein